MEIVAAIAIGYLIGLLQNGIHIHKAETEIPKDENGREVYNNGIPANREIEEYVNKNDGIKNW